jgi:hypothetical protein
MKITNYFKRVVKSTPSTVDQAPPVIATLVTALELVIVLGAVEVNPE